jgi:putative membrane protein
LGILNAPSEAYLVILTFLTIVTLGLFLLVINALMFLLAGSLVKGFEVKSFGSALLGSLIVSIVSFVAH